VNQFYRPDSGSRFAPVKWVHRLGDSRFGSRFAPVKLVHWSGDLSLFPLYVCDDVPTELVSGQWSRTSQKLPVQRIKRGGPHQLGVISPSIISSHAPRLPGRRPSSAVHLFGALGRVGRLKYMLNQHNIIVLKVRSRYRRMVDVKG
jgi:hypothetical protein